jgi:divalent metal cation (Fe/Co/Zn/Cd) transporter
MENAELQKKARKLQVLTIVWMTVEAAVSLLVAAKARSVALVGFGGDSAIELISAVLVYWRFRHRPGISERTAAKLAAGLLFGLAAFILCASVLVLVRPKLSSESSLIGIAVLMVAAIGMPLLAQRKRALAKVLESDALKADATQSSVCGYLAWIALAGLVLNAAFHLSWADPLAALLLLPIVLKEANEARQGTTCQRE